ncbi:MAG: outer membrane lipoprotein-sorting protein [Chthoniobacteraceae bacterium]|nr:outer membrane lipoprotein-sorting protein [Chthoniobacteraceae bacterium]
MKITNHPARLLGTLLAGLLLCAPGLTRAEVSENPTARELLALVRANQAGQERDLSGKLRMSTSEAKIIIPFRLLLRGNTIIYQFTDRPESLILRLDEKASRLDRATGSGKTEKITGAKLDDPVRGTDISYEDLSLKFLYWNNAVIEKEKERLMTRTCWIVRAVPSRKDDSQYDMARLWIEPTGGLLQAECYAGGKLIRRFSVRNVQSAHDTGGYILKSMSIQRMDESGKKDRYPTYLDIQQN